MAKCLKFLIIVTFCAIGETTSKAVEDYKQIKKDFISIDVENSKLKLENAQLKLEISLLKSANFNLSEQINELSTQRDNCSVFWDSIDNISANLVDIQHELMPLTAHFHINKTNTDPIELLKTVSENQKNVSESLKSFMEEIKVSTTDQANNMSVTLNNFLNELKITKQLKKPRNCAEAEGGQVGVFLVEIPESNLGPFPVYCDPDNWMVILRRIDASVNFERQWPDFKSGFGDIDGNYMMGLEKIHQVTKSQCHELKVIVEDFENNSTYALYEQFGIDDENNAYALKTLGKYSGTAGDALTYSKGMKFSTVERDNDEASDNCASKDKAAWWYRDCSISRLTGLYLSGGVINCEGIRWHDEWRYCYSYKFAKMMIRPTTC